jgi:hypothetical protein
MRLVHRGQARNGSRGKRLPTLAVLERVLERGDKGNAVVEAKARLFGHRPSKHLVDRPSKRLVESACQGGLLTNDLENERRNGGRMERLLARQQFVGNHRKRELV